MHAGPEVEKSFAQLMHPPGAPFRRVLFKRGPAGAHGLAKERAMGIGWDQQRRTLTAGYAADFCLLCRDVRPFRIDRVLLRSGFAGVSLGRARPGGHLACCLHCQSTLPPHLERFERLRPSPAELSVLVAETQPDLYERYAQRLQLEETLAADPASVPASLRRELVTEALVAVNHEISEHAACPPLDRAVALWAVVVGLVSFGVVPALVADIVRRTDVEAAFMIAAAVVLAWIVSTADARYLRRAIYPKLATALRPLAPARADLDAALRRLLQRRLRAGATLRSDALMQWIGRVPPSASPAPVRMPAPVSLPVPVSAPDPRSPSIEPASEMSVHEVHLA